MHGEVARNFFSNQIRNLVLNITKNEQLANLVGIIAKKLLSNFSTSESNNDIISSNFNAVGVTGENLKEQIKEYTARCCGNLKNDPNNQNVCSMYEKNPLLNNAEICPK